MATVATYHPRSVLRHLPVRSPSYSHQCTGILSKSPNDDKKCRKEKNCWKKHAIATIKLPNQMPVCECTIVEEKSEMRTKNLTYILRCKKTTDSKFMKWKKKLVKSLFNVCHCSCCWCCDNNIGHCKLLSCKNLQWTMVEKSKKISSQLMHDENIFFPRSFAVFILPIWIDFGIFKELFLQIIGAQRTIFNRYFIC